MHPLLSEYATKKMDEVVKNYDNTINYHPGKANVVADALSRKSVHVASMMILQQELIENFRDLNLTGTTQLMSGFIFQVKSDLQEEIKEAQEIDSMAAEIKVKVKNGADDNFELSPNGLICYKKRIYIPPAKDLRVKILEEAHKTPYTLHLGMVKMYHDLKELYWWPGMKSDVTKFVVRCLTCQKVKAEHKKPPGLLQPIELPEWKWDNITMDFVKGLPRTASGNNAIWVIVDRLTKSAHFLAIKGNCPLERLAELYAREVVRLHGVPSSVISDRDTQFTSRFWELVHEAMGTQLRFSTAYHPQTDGQSERTIQILEDMLRACALDFKTSWDKILPYAEFAYNNSYQASIQMAPYKALYGRRCRSPLCWTELTERKLYGPELVDQSIKQIKVIKERLLTAQSRQKSYADKRRRFLEFKKGDHVFLKVSPTTGIGRSIKQTKLNPRFVGPFEILDKVGKLAYRIALPPHLSRLHDVFHVSQLKKYQPDPDHVLEYESLEVQDNLTFNLKALQKELLIVSKRISVIRTFHL